MRRRDRWAPSLAGMLAVTMVVACGDDGGGGAPGGQVIGGPDANLEIGFGPGADGGAGNGPDGALEDGAPEAVETPIGEACAGDDDCGTSGVCLDAERYPGGYCSELGCERPSDCGGGVCVARDDETFCADRCLSGTQCRNGYACINQPGSPLSACLPVGNPGGVADGEPCTIDGDCRGGTCIDSDGWLDGYCTTTFCENFEDCASDGQDNRCLVQRGGTNFCVRICTESSACRDGYVCQGLGGGIGYCSPNPFEPIEVDPETYPLDITCQPVPEDGILSIDFEIAPETSAYMVTPYASDGVWLSPIRVELPGDGTLDFGGQNDFQLTGAQLFGWTNPTVVPATPQLVEQLQPGEHRFVLETGSEEICHYVLQEATPGTTIDFNVYFVGVPEVNAETAGDNADLAAMLEITEEIYSAAGVSIGEVRFIDITGDDADRFSILRSEEDVGDLVSLSQLPGDSADAALSANVFFVRAIALGGAIGISSGLPGPAALHGTGGSGVVFTSEFLGERFRERGGEVVDGNGYTAVVFAHEVGHYLGLFHTSEQFGFGFDPLPDTPRCSGQGFPDDCDDLNNLMFPMAGIEHREVSDDQAWVIQVNPLTKE